LVIKKFQNFFPNLSFKIKKKQIFFESKLLKLNCEKANKLLNWRPKLNINQTVSFTAVWYKTYLTKLHKSMHQFTISQIKDFINYKK